MKLSIVIPVYNVSLYLRRCLDSILAESTSYAKEFEVIIVDDGSTDGSSKIIEEYSRKYSNIRHYFHTNSGLSYTRNIGLSHCCGDYVWFVDSDDYLCRGWSAFLPSFLEYGYDIIALTTEIETEGQKKVVQRNNLKQKEYSIPFFYSHGYLYPYSGVQFYVFKRRLLIDNKLQFEVGVYYEDILFTPIVFSFAISCYYLPTPIYAYVIRHGSITSSSMSLKKCCDILQIADKLQLFLRTHRLSIDKKRMIYSSIATIGGVYYTAFYSKINISMKEKVLQQFCKRTYWFKSFFISGKIYYIIRWIKMHYLNFKYGYFNSKSN